ncbi:MAG TPA: hypothetical protein VN512_13025 [Clostridia bacterium]|nr:hypothetical protein [Clostridia bacterium]
METKTISIIKGLTEEMEAISRDRDLYRDMYRSEKERADKAELALKAKEDNF